MSNIKITKQTIFTMAGYIMLVLLCIFLCSCANNQSSDNKDHATLTYQIPDKTINLNSFGSLDADVSPEEFLNHYTPGDVVNVKIEGDESTLTMPVCRSYDDVSPGELVLLVKEGEQYITLAISYGQFGIQYGYLEQNAEGSSTKYSAIPGKLPTSVTISLKEAGAYKDRLKVGELKESNSREAYPELSDESFANFRDVKCGTIRPGVLYRSSSPIDSKIGRNNYSDNASKNNKLVSALNLQDSEEEAKAYPGYAGSYYSGMKIKYLQMDVSYGSEEFNNDMSSSLRFIIENDGPYLIHCVYGKDRAGLVCAVLEAICGASTDEISEDYRQTYTNLYNVVNDVQEPIDSDTLNTIDSLIIDNLSYTFRTELDASNINQKAEEYVKSIGLTQDEINLIRQKLK